jgi:NAD-dependent deacetylase sirtuin 2
LLGEIIKGLRQKQYTRVVTLVGAGISVAAGVPDFRSPGGLYDQMRKQGFEHPMQVFTADFLTSHPEQFYKIFSQIRTEHLNPTRVHEFIRLLDDKGCLLRCYTQNIDGLERKVGLPKERIVEAHGTMCEARCLECGTASTPEVLWAEWEKGQLPRCTSQGCTGLLRPNVVFFGEQLHPRFMTMSADDLKQADLVLIMGTSLSVEPFASLVQKAPRVVPRLLINRHVPYVMQRRLWELLTPSALSKRRQLRKDASIIGECDDGALQLMRGLGWEGKAGV